MSEYAPKARSQLTGNTGLFHVAREFSRRGWYVMLTVRNARGADLYVANIDETVVIPIQSKALSKRSDVPLGSSLQSLRSPWWVVTMNANSDAPTCYILSLDEVKALAGKDTKDGRDSYWLPYRKYAVADYEEAWGRLGKPDATCNEVSEK